MLSEKRAELLPQSTVLVYHGKSQKFCQRASCGMGAAVGIRVMRQRVRGVENAVRKCRVILSADLPFGVIARWQRNELVEAQFKFNKSRG